jgi:Ser/Thr protein kinase RdoA (MazF antagonist)
LEVFGLEGRLQLAATGLDSTYRLHGAVPAAIRVASYPEVRTVAALQTEAAWIDALSSAPVVVPGVRRTTSGSRVAVVEGRAVIALDWLPGRKMRWRFTPRHAHALAAAMAHLHVHASTFEPPADGWAKDWNARICGLGGADVLVPVVGDVALDVVAGVEARVAAACDALGSVERHLINGDIGPHNAVWVDGVPGLFDFNDLGLGYAGLDLARYVRSLRWRDGGDALAAAVLDGYSSVVPLPESYRVHGELFEVASDLFLAGYLAGKVPERGPDAAATAVRLVERATRFLD